MYRCTKIGGHKSLEEETQFLGSFCNAKKKRWCGGWLYVQQQYVLYVFFGGQVGLMFFSCVFALEGISFHQNVWFQGKIYGVGIQSPNLRMVSWKLNEVIGHPDHLTR